jgi:hypothetical protein
MSTGSNRWEDWFSSGEKLLWQGAPRIGVVHWGRNIFFTAFGIPFLGFGLLAVGMGLRHLAALTVGDFFFGVFITAFSVPFTAVGGAMVFGCWIADYIQPRRTRYALTNKAGYIATNYWGRKMDVFPLRVGSNVELEEHRNGTSSVHFHFERKRDSDGDLQTEKKGFTDIEDGQTVYRLIRDAMDELETARDE